LFGAGGVGSCRRLIGTAVFGISVLDGVAATFTGANANGFVDAGDKNLAIADPAGLGCLLDGINNPFTHSLVNDHFDFYLWQKIDYIFSAAIKFSMAFLTAKPFCFQNSDALNANVVECLFNLIELKRLYNGFDFFHHLHFPFVAPPLRRVKHGIVYLRAITPAQWPTDKRLRRQHRIICRRMLFMQYA
jgi:hypothetical protein